MSGPLTHTTSGGGTKSHHISHTSIDAGADTPSPEPTSVPSASPRANLTISPNFKRHRQLAPQEGATSATVDSTSTTTDGDNNLSPPSQPLRRNSYLSSARRAANTHDTPSPVAAPSTYFNAPSTKTQSSHAAIISQPQPQQQLSHPRGSPTRRRRSWTTDSLTGPHGSLDSRSSSSMSHLPTGLASRQSTYPSTSSPALPFGNYVFEEGWFVLTTPPAHHNQLVFQPRPIQVGPLSKNILRTMLRNNHISPHSLVWHTEIGQICAGDSGWQPINRISLLQSTHLNTATLVPPVENVTLEPRRGSAAGLNSTPPPLLFNGAGGGEGDPLLTSPLLMHTLLIDELLEQEEQYVKDLHVLVHYANSASPNVTNNTVGPDTLFQVLLRKFQPLLTKLFQSHKTFLSAIQSYSRSLYSQIATLQSGEANPNNSSYSNSNKSLLFSPFLAFLPLEIPRNSSVHIELEVGKKPSPRPSLILNEWPLSSSLASATSTQSTSTNQSQTSYQYYQYLILFMKLMREENIFPYSTHLKTGAAAAPNHPGTNTGLGSAHHHRRSSSGSGGGGGKRGSSGRTDSQEGALDVTAFWSGNLSEAAIHAMIAKAAKEQQDAIQESLLSSSAVPSASPTPLSSSPTSANGMGGGTVSTSHSIFQTSLCSMLSAFHTSLRTRKQRLRLALASHQPLSVRYSPTSSRRGSSGSSGHSGSSLASSERSSQKSPASMTTTFPQDSFDQMWMTEVSEDGNITNAAGGSNLTTASLSTLPSSNLPSGGVGAPTRARNKRASLSNLSQIMEGKEVAAVAPVAAPANETSTNGAAEANTIQTRSRNSSLTSSPSFGVLSAAQQNLLLRPLYQVTFYGLILKELLSLHSTTSSHQQQQYQEAHTSPILSSPNELENLWHSFYSCSFLLSHSLYEESLRYQHFQLVALEKFVFNSSLDEVVIRHRIASSSHPRRVFKMSTEIGVYFSTSSNHHLQANGKPSNGNGQIIFLQWFLFNDLILCGKKLGASQSLTTSGPHSRKASVIAANGVGMNGATTSQVTMTTMDHHSRHPSSSSEDDAATPKLARCSYQQAWPIDTSLTVRSISQPSANISPTITSNLFSLELASFSKRLLLYFRTESERSRWLMSLNESIAQQKEIAAHTDTMTNFPSPPPGLASALQALCSSGMNGGANNGLNGNNHHISNISRCYSCTSFLLPGYRTSVWCATCEQMVCSACGIHGACDTELPSSSPNGLDRRTSSCASEDDLNTSSASYDDHTVDHCLRCKPPKQLWPDLSCSPLLIEGWTGNNTNNHHVNSGGLTPSSANEPHMFHQASDGHIPTPSSATSGGHSRSGSSRPDGVRRISSSRDSNGREIVTMVGAGGVLVLGQVSSTVASSSNASTGATATPIAGQRDLSHRHSSQTPLSNYTHTTAAHHRVAPLTITTISPPRTNTSSSSSSSMSTTTVITSPSPMRQEGFKPSTNSGSTSRGSSGSYYGTSQNLPGIMTSPMMMHSPRHTDLSGGSGQDGSSTSTPLSSTPYTPHQIPHSISGLSAQLLTSADSPFRRTSARCSPEPNTPTHTSRSHQRTSTNTSTGSSDLTAVQHDRNNELFDPSQLHHPHHHAHHSSSGSDSISHLPSTLSPRTPHRSANNSVLQSPGSSHRFMAESQTHRDSGGLPTSSSSVNPLLSRATSCSTPDHLSASSSTVSASFNKGSPSSTTRSYNSGSSLEAFAFPREYLEVSHWQITIQVRDVEACGKRGRYTTYDILLRGVANVQEANRSSHSYSHSDLVASSPSTSSAATPITPATPATPITPPVFELETSKRYSEFHTFDSTVLKKFKKKHPINSAATSGSTSTTAAAVVPTSPNTPSTTLPPSFSFSNVGVPNSSSTTSTAVGALKYPSLPPAVMFDRFSPSVVEERRVGFEAYLNVLLNGGVFGGSSTTLMGQLSDVHTTELQLKILVLNFLYHKSTTEQAHANATSTTTA